MMFIPNSFAPSAFLALIAFALFVSETDVRLPPPYAQLVIASRA